MANKKTVKQLKRAQKVNHNESFAEYLNFLMSGQVESEEQAHRINALAKKHTTFAEAAAISKILVAQIDHKLSQVMEAVRVQQIVLEKLEATDEMFQAAQDQYEQELAAVEAALNQVTQTKEEAPEEAVNAPEEELTLEDKLEELKEVLEANDAEAPEEE